MKARWSIIAWLLAWSWLPSLQGQVYTLKPGTPVVLKQGTPFFADSLVLIPAADFKLTYSSLVKSGTTQHPLTTAHIARVYRFCGTAEPFSGAVKMAYLEGAELSGLAENSLTLDLFNGQNWRILPPAERDLCKNQVTVNGIRQERLAELTLVECPPPRMQCPADLLVYTQAGQCGAVVQYASPVVSDICGSARVDQTGGLPAGAFFPAGVTRNTFTAVSSSGKTTTGSFTVTVVDREAPQITGLSAQPATLWPPDHQMQLITLSYDLQDACGRVTPVLSVSSNEPESGTGSGDLSPDWLMIDPHQLQLRAERSGSGAGRIYTITVTARDDAGNTSRAATRVLVPQHAAGNLKPEASSRQDGLTGTALRCTVSPNPSAQQFTVYVSAPSDLPITLRLTDLAGRQIARWQINRHQRLQTGADLKPGIYLLEAVQGNDQQVIRLLKQ